MRIRPEHFPEVPVNRFLGLELRSRSAEEAVVELPVREELLQETGVVHGGILSTLADTAAVYVLFPELEEGWSMTSIELKVSFLAPGRPEPEPLRARAELVRRGRTVGLCRVDVTQGSRHLLTGLFTYLFLRKA